MSTSRVANRGLVPAAGPRTTFASTVPPRSSATGRRGTASTSQPSSPAASPPSSPAPHRTASTALNRGTSWSASSDVDAPSGGSPAMSRSSSLGECRQDVKRPGEAATAPPVNLFHCIQQLSAAENALWNILDGLKSNTTHSSYFCREYWGSSASHAQLSLEKMQMSERVKRQVQLASVLESLSLGVASHLCSGTMNGISVTIRTRLRNLLYYVHENCLVLLDMVVQRWVPEDVESWQEAALKRGGNCPENINFEILARVKRYRKLRKGEHVMALRQHNEMITNVVRQLCRGAVAKRAPLSSRGDRSPGLRSPGPAAQQTSVLVVINEILGARTPLDRLRPSAIRNKMLQSMYFQPLLNFDGADDCPWPASDSYKRWGTETFSPDGTVIWFEPLPPMLPNLEEVPKLPPLADPDTYTLVLDLDETLIHYYEQDGMGSYDIRPNMHEFLARMHQLGFELVIFTAATQDYADWVIDQIDPDRLIHYRLYRQHALPWGPIYVKDLTALGRDLSRTLIIDNVQENFMLQPHHGIFILTWYDDPEDNALRSLTPLLEELITTRVTVPAILSKYREQIPIWAGFDPLSQMADYDDVVDDMQQGVYSDYEQQLPNQSEWEHEQLQNAFVQQPQSTYVHPSTAPSLQSSRAPSAASSYQPQQLPQQPQQQLPKQQPSPPQQQQATQQQPQKAPQQTQQQPQQQAQALSSRFHQQPAASQAQQIRQDNGYPPSTQQQQQQQNQRTSLQAQQPVQQRPAQLQQLAQQPRQMQPAQQQQQPQRTTQPLQSQMQAQQLQQQARAPSQQQPQQYIQRPQQQQQQPQPQVQHQRQAPTHTPFSALGGVSGPLQAPPPTHAHHLPAAKAASAPTTQTLWTRPGLGPCQAPRR
jgi:Dullard-like phosphatase family protein